MRIFLSYASEDRQLAEAVTLALSGDGHEVFFDRSGLPPGGNYHERIRAAVGCSELIVFLITPRSIAKGSYALTELAYAQARWAHPKHHVLPVRLEDVPWEELPPYLKAVTVLEPTGNVEAAVLTAVAGLERIAGTPNSADHSEVTASGDRSRRRDATRVTVPLLVALVGALGVVAAAFISSRKPTEPPRWTATIEDCYVERAPVTVDEYLARTNSKEAAAEKRLGYSSERLTVRGRVVGFRVHFNGLPQERYHVFFRMFDSETGDRIRVFEDEDVPLVTLRQDSPEDAFRDILWFEPSKSGTEPRKGLTVQLEVRSKRFNQPMAQCDTPVFSLQ